MPVSQIIFFIMALNDYYDEYFLFPCSNIIVNLYYKEETS
jgi:hypothetical protein